jgi:hypothetical protein
VELTIAGNDSPEFDCPKCGCRIRYAPRRPAVPNDDDDAEDLSSRLYSDLEAANHARRQRKTTLIMVLSLLGSFAAMFVVVVLLALRTSGKIAQGPVVVSVPTSRGNNLLPRKNENDTPKPTVPSSGGHESRMDEPPNSPVEPPGREAAFPENSRGNGEAIPTAGKGNSDKPAANKNESDKPEVEDANKRPTLDDPANDAAKRGNAEFKSKLEILQFRLRTDVRSTSDEILASARDLAMIEKIGKPAACRELCRAIIRDDGKQTAVAGALREINESLHRPVLAMLRNDDFNSRLAAVRDILQLSEDDARDAAFGVLLHFKQQILQNARRYGSKIDYPAIADAGVVVEALFATCRDKEELRQKLQPWLQKDPNWHVRAVAARYYGQVEKSPEAAVRVLIKQLNALQSVKHPQRDELCIAIIESLKEMGAQAKSAVRDLRDRAEKDPSPKVRETADEARRAIENAS